MENIFGTNIIPHNEEDRLRALHRYDLNEVPKRHFTNLAKIIAVTFDVPIALVSLVDRDTVSFPGNYGMKSTKEVSRGINLCSLAVLDEKPTVFEDALKEPCLLANPLVTGKLVFGFTPVHPFAPTTALQLVLFALLIKNQEAFPCRSKTIGRVCPYCNAGIGHTP